MTHCWIVALIACSTILLPRPTLAQSTREAKQQDAAPAGYRELVDEALLEYRNGNFEEVRSLLLRAHALFPNARTLRGLGMAEFELRNYVKSAELLSQALQSTRKALPADLRRETETLLRRAQGYLAEVQLTLHPADTTLQVNGQDVAATDGKLTLQLGDYELWFRAPGFVSQQRKLTLAGGEKLALDVTLVADAPAQAAPTPREVAAAESSALTHKDEAPPRHGSKSPLYKNPWLWSGVALAVAAAVTVAIVVPRANATPSPHYYGGDTNTVLHGE